MNSAHIPYHCLSEHLFVFLFLLNYAARKMDSEAEQAIYGSFPMFLFTFSFVFSP